VPEEPPPLEELYEPDVLARIDAVLAHHGVRDADAFFADGSVDGPVEGEPDVPQERGPVSIEGKVAEWAAHSAVGGMLRGVGKAVEDLLRNEIEIVQEVHDESAAGADHRPVRVVLVPDAPKASKAFVRPWLFARRRDGGG
jgi:hypothetical protein